VRGMGGHDDPAPPPVVHLHSDTTALAHKVRPSTPGTHTRTGSRTAPPRRRAYRQQATRGEGAITSYPPNEPPTTVDLGPSSPDHLALEQQSLQ